MTPAFRMETLAATHPGLVRRVNEDCHSQRGQEGLVVVADGMGGHANGDWASQAVVHALDSAAIPPGFRDAVQVVADGIHSANRRIWAESQRRQQQMGSTVVALLIGEGCFAALWVGDSRIYLLRDGNLHLITRDHSQVQVLVDRGVITAEEAKHHPRGHVLARAIGVGARLQVDVVTDEVQAGDLFLLCSDGLTAVLDEDKLASTLCRTDQQGAIDRLIDATLEGGAPDNVTVILAGIQEATQLNLGGQP